MIEEEPDDSPAAPATHIESLTSERSETERALMLANAVLLIESVTRPVRGKTIVAIGNFFGLHGHYSQATLVRFEKVLGGGLEPPRLSAYAPQTYVSAISPPELCERAK